jgi:RimJ/RimL family protein N-acetyltransferase
MLRPVATGGSSMLAGNRVRLRPFEQGDAHRLWEYENDFESHVLGDDTPPRPWSLARVEAELEAVTTAAGADREEFAIEADGRLIGACNLRDFDATALTCAFGIWIGDPSYRGAGYGREALTLLLDYAFRIRNQRKVTLDVQAVNASAIRLYRALGFVEEARQREQVWVDGRYGDLVHMGLFRHEWEAAHRAATMPAEDRRHESEEAWRPTDPR